MRLLADDIPAAWDALWEGPASPSDYVRAVVSRAVAIESWWAKSQAGNLLTSGVYSARTYSHTHTHNQAHTDANRYTQR